ncbi:hypothetical protein LY76DRAFT_324979 [Colletotrichum caudatum]|nr:hypothetical protein LY76DRAFT_324979 [Colletotrichum caudatum]
MCLSSRGSRQCRSKFSRVAIQAIVGTQIFLGMLRQTDTEEKLFDVCIDIIVCLPLFLCLASLASHRAALPRPCMHACPVLNVEI